ncbi:threonine ammonia-lyase [Marinivivus vitaminiproducens]|uniref:threonine ammonia-lyase n=1 Tax=Marinivivus vitaminiproducens TaxID=3035935 RepID=UPI0027A293ED|nr:threonine/serine dehydratase [Geminicoccaceae bacterium SCSIO 64248]
MADNLTTQELLPGVADIEAAAERLRDVAVRTPLLEFPALNERTRARVLVKAETLQRTGSFKFRGAYNAIAQAPGRPVVAYSSGNHAQGVAAAAQILGVPATIIMPADAPRMKLENTRSYGAEVIAYDRYREVREAIGARIAEEQGAVLIKPYDAPATIAGQGTCGLEIAAQAEAAGARLDVALVCCGGGGLIAGVSTALRDRMPGIAVHAVEPSGFDDTARSLAAGERQSVVPGATTICDALMASTPGELTFAINRRTLETGLVVSDDEVREAMRYAFRVLKLVVEPGGAVALAALLSRKLDLTGRTVAVVLSGGNVDPGTFARIIAPT